MKSMTLRRTKALLVDTLPPKTVEVHTLKLDAPHREAYDLLHRYLNVQRLHIKYLYMCFIYMVYSICNCV
jgi:hypothetical protein